MRITSVLVIAAMALTGAVVGCGANEVDMGEGGANPTPTVTVTPTPSATPNPAMFDAVQTFLEIGGTPNRANCGQATCHIPPTGAGPFALYTTTGTATADKDKNRIQLSCSPNIDNYVPEGLVISTFCNPNGTAQTAPQHAGRTNLTNADCAAIFAWLQSGEGTPEACP
jgi:hypothetical protein